ncbi:DUF2802 domain-containing protein [Methylomarinum vadi]|uniref:DUF2802 domain-containing protein n=1 Tax=Methylomarinum vadi TaxID=438855 RepID=UPI0004DF04D9|nr:DUF2802 domain-containing protein [Methylomarinum vadi]
MSEILLAATLAMLIVMFALLFWLFVEHNKLKRVCRELEQVVGRNSKDIAGICSAAVSVDNRLQGNDERLKDIATKLAQTERQEPQDNHSSHSYHSAIQRIHRGAGPEELVRECGLSRDEAVLLISLYGLKK